MVFKDVFRDRYKAMSAVLLRYYELALNDFTRGFEELFAKMREEARHESMTIPVELFEHKSDQATLRKYKLADYITSLEDVQERFENTEGFFTD